MAGYAYAMDLVFEVFADMRLRKNPIRRLHPMVLRYRHEDGRHLGSYQTLDNRVVALDADGREIGVIVETVTPFDTPREMEELVAWAVKAMDEEAPRLRLTIAVFVVAFLAIHPFQNGNSRLSRILTTLLWPLAGMNMPLTPRLKAWLKQTRTCITTPCAAPTLR